MVIISKIYLKNLNFTDEKSEKATFLDDISKLSFYQGASNKKKLVIIKNGDHSLSSQKPLRKIIKELQTIIKNMI